MTNNKKLKRDTITTRAGRDSQRFAGMVNTPVFRGSTVLFPDVHSYEARVPDNFKAMRYGTHGTPTTFALEDAVALPKGPEGFAQFGLRRMARTARITRQSGTMAGVYHLEGLQRAARNTVLRAMPEHWFLARLGWIYRGG